MRPPKNFDNKMNRRKQLLPEVPQATAADVGKVLGVDSSGAWELKDNLLIIQGTISSIPKPTSASFIDTVKNILAKIKECMDKNIDVVIRLVHTNISSVVTTYEYKVTNYSYAPNTGFTWCYAEVTRTVYNDGIYNCSMYLESSNTSTSTTIINTKLS